MFETDPILFLQAHGSGLVTAFLHGISELGYFRFYVVALALLTFGYRFRAGMALLQVVLTTALLTDIAKQTMALPRPYRVDARVMRPDAAHRPPPVAGARPGTGFWVPLDQATLAATRAEAPSEYGLPSGHVSCAVAFWFGLALLGGSRLLWVPALAMAVLMPLSRMYLGLHFLGDVLAGALLGAAVLALAFVALIRERARHTLLEATGLPRPDRLTRVLAWTWLAAVPPALALLLSGYVSPVAAGRFWGVNLALLLVGLHGYPADAAAASRRVARTVLALVVYYVLRLGTVWLFPGATGGHAAIPIVLLVEALPPLAMLWLSTAASLRLGLFAGRAGESSQRPADGARP